MHSQAGGTVHEVANGALIETHGCKAAGQCAVNRLELLASSAGGRCPESPICISLRRTFALFNGRTFVLDTFPTQPYCWVMIPELDASTGYLPPGIHLATWAEVAPRFAVNGHRTRLTTGLKAALLNLAGAGCRSVLLDGSFVSEKVLPEDYDGAYDTVGVNPYQMDPVFFDFSNSRAAMKAKYGGELFPVTANAGGGVLYRDFFLKDRNGVPKGVVQIDLGSLP